MKSPRPSLIASGSIMSSSSSSSSPSSCKSCDRRCCSRPCRDGPLPRAETRAGGVSVPASASAPSSAGGSRRVSSSCASSASDGGDGGGEALPPAAASPRAVGAVQAPSAPPAGAPSPETSGRTVLEFSAPTPSSSSTPTLAFRLAPPVCPPCCRARRCCCLRLSACSLCWRSSAVERVDDVGRASYTRAGMSSSRSSASSTSTLSGPPGSSTAHKSYSDMAASSIHVVHSGILVNQKATMVPTKTR
mmetsp:Transcript_7638/g.31020  ORF Transcript_7638/g.31020 Transcript_7638/m.31020 type:complete len:247 (-) Transcript_7638:566-1306(-)